MRRVTYIMMGVILVVTVVVMVVSVQRSVPAKPPSLVGARTWFDLIGDDNDVNDRRRMRKMSAPFQSVARTAYAMIPTEIRGLQWMPAQTHGGVVWIRLGSPPLIIRRRRRLPESAADDDDHDDLTGIHGGSSSSSPSWVVSTADWIRRTVHSGGGRGVEWDLDTFAQTWLPRLTSPTVLVTTDGDASVPSDLRPDTVQAILECRLVRAWFTQNWDGRLVHPKLRPMPIGLDLQARWFGLDKWPEQRVRHIESIPRTPDASRRMRLWSDGHLKTFPGRHGDPRATLQRLVRDPASRHQCRIDAPERRLDVDDVWRRYASYAMVVSVHGNGLDCHRTWEALFLGAVVVTTHSSLDVLLDPWRVLYVSPDFSELRDTAWVDREWRRLVETRPAWCPIDRSEWLARFRAALDE